VCGCGCVYGFVCVFVCMGVCGGEKGSSVNLRHNPVIRLEGLKLTTKNSG